MPHTVRLPTAKPEPKYPAEAVLIAQVMAEIGERIVAALRFGHCTSRTEIFHDDLSYGVSVELTLGRIEARG